MKYDTDRGMGYRGENVPGYFEEIIETHGKLRKLHSHAMYTIEKNYIQYCFSCIPIAFNGGVH
jgi:hypothetical protein